MLAKTVEYGLVSGKHILDIVEYQLREELLRRPCAVELADN
jgi:hypothetical protein